MGTARVKSECGITDVPGDFCRSRKIRPTPCAGEHSVRLFPRSGKSDRTRPGDGDIPARLSDETRPPGLAGRHPGAFQSRCRRCYFEIESSGTINLSGESRTGTPRPPLFIVSTDGTGT